MKSYMGSQTMISAFKSLIVMLFIISPAIHAEELALGQTSSISARDAEFKVGACILSVQNTYKRVTKIGFEIIPLADAKADSECPRLRDYSEVETAYKKLF